MVGGMEWDELKMGMSCVCSKQLRLRCQASEKHTRPLKGPWSMVDPNIGPVEQTPIP
jgi:hypothetical protein